MKKDIEEILEEKGTLIKTAKIPDEIENYIKTGIEKGKKRKLILKQRKKFSYIAAGIVLVLFVMSIRLSTSVAAYISQIPGFQSIVHLIRYDKGLDLAVKNNFIQPIYLSKEDEGMKVSIDGLIVDESRIIVFYSIESKSDKPIKLKDIKLYDDNNQPLEDVSVSWSGFDNLNKEKVSFIDIAFSEEKDRIPDKLNVDFEFKGIKSSLFNFSIPIDKEKFIGLKEVFILNKTVEIDKQKITFEKVIIYPTRIAVYISYDTKNTKKILGFYDMKITDEDNDIFGQISNGVTSTIKDDNNIILYFQSNFFKKPKNLYIVFSKIKAIDKDKEYVLIDLKNNTILNKPDEKLNLNDIVNNGNYIELVFTIEKIDNSNNYYSPFYSEFEDSSMKKYNFSNWSIHGVEKEKIEKVIIKIPNVSYNNPVKFKIVDYPLLVGDKEIKIKVK
ncbi:DUF4179 domain-containing protein [Caldanaerobacter subterraneus]|uniref:DUF4179 domain-containing protein n=1 Tax=Caldanaerobacter subterraneus TaxID=911092 RepID=UPI001F0F72CE|nr:DUF4179 domain-containing protein [Caldanaerobacter subterraneus]